MQVGKLDSHTQKSQTGLFCHTMHTNKFKWNHKISRRKLAIHFYTVWQWPSQYLSFFGIISLHTGETKANINSITSACNAFAQWSKLSTKGPATEWENTVLNDETSMGLIFKIHKQLIQLHIKETNNLIK